MFEGWRLEGGCARTTDIPFLAEVSDRNNLAAGCDQHEVILIQTDRRALSVGELESRVQAAGPRRRHKMAAHSRVIDQGGEFHAAEVQFTSAELSCYLSPP